MPQKNSLPPFDEIQKRFHDRNVYILGDNRGNTGRDRLVEGFQAEQFILVEGKLLFSTLWMNLQQILYIIMK